jgi:hypothetical protein
MKRTELLKYLREQGCEFIREGKAPVTPGGGIRVKTNALLYHGTQKLTMTLQEKYAKTLE